MRKIWVDMDNTPHVPFFIPIIAELRRRGYEVITTARDAFQVCELADKRGMAYRKIGRHHGKHKLVKFLGLYWRAMQLLPFAITQKPDLAISHGARSQVIISNLLGIPSVIMSDYEFGKVLPTMRPTWEIVPEVIPDEALAVKASRVRKYPGIKEDVYAPSFKPDPALLEDLGLSTKDLVITVRPPATEAHYHNPASVPLFVRLMERGLATPDAKIVLLPRNQSQKEWILQQWPQWFAGGKCIIPTKAVDGMNLLHYSDLVVSGGGTMNREAAAIGVPVYSIFRGPTGAVDKYLTAEKRLIMIETLEDVDQKILIHRRERPEPSSHTPFSPTLNSIVEHLEQILKLHARS